MGVIRRHRVLAGLGVGVVVAIAGLAWVLSRIDTPGPASVDDALSRFQQDGGDQDGPAAGEVGPAAGVYTYAGEGSEHLSFPPLDQQDGAEMPGSVIHEEGGCWTFRLDYNAWHWQEWRYCADADGEGIVETGGVTGQTWDIGVSTVSNTTTMRCDPANPVVWAGSSPGESVDQSCSGTNTSVDGETTSAGTWRFGGPDVVTVGGHDVEALHFYGDRAVTGAQEGTERTEAWFATDGLLLRYERDIEVNTDSPVGAITYTESGWFELADLEPRR